jgi:hypothetical protein
MIIEHVMPMFRIIEKIRQLVSFVVVVVVVVRMHKFAFRVRLK